jgi:hypothetical protein
MEVKTSKRCVVAPHNQPLRNPAPENAGPYKDEATMSAATTALEEASNLSRT